MSFLSSFLYVILLLFYYYYYYYYYFLLLYLELGFLSVAYLTVANLARLGILFIVRSELGPSI